MKKFLITITLFVVIVLLILGGTAIYFGLVPGISGNFVKRVDLGIENNPQLSLDLRNKVGIQFNIPEDQLPTDKDVVYEGQIDIEQSLSSEQLTSILNTVSTQQTSMPFSNVQIRINEDGTAEASFNLNVETTVNEAKKLGYSEEDIEKGKKYLGVLGDTVYVYTKLSMEMMDNELSVNPYVFRIQNFNVPTNITKMVAEVGSNAIEDRLSKVPNLDIKSLKQEGNKLNFSGTIPQSLRAVD